MRLLTRQGLLIEEHGVRYLAGIEVLNNAPSSRLLNRRSEIPCRRDGVHLIALDTITCAFPPSRRFARLTPRMRRIYVAGNSWVVRHPTFSFFFAGDAGYSQDFADVDKRLGPFDLAAIPIGSYAPRWFMRIMHVDPAEAVKDTKRLACSNVLVNHWGTFANLADDPLEEAPRALAEALAAHGLSAHDFFVLKHGETRRFAPPRE